MKETPRGLRTQIGIFGRRNTGKSSLLNAICKQEVSIVADYAGTTTDPVEKAMELLPLGPVLFIDTAGVDDTGQIGELRTEKTKKIFSRTDFALIVSEPDKWTDFEEKLVEIFSQKNTPCIVIFNKIDTIELNQSISRGLEQRKIPFISVSAKTGKNIKELKELIAKLAPEPLANKNILSGILNPGEFAVLVVPIDLEAPKGRLILPQVQTIREILDNDSCCIIVKERELKFALESLKNPPALVITDSQAFLKVSADVPENIPLTSFSILMARQKGDLEEFVKGATSISKLKSGDKILIAEACTHHPIGEDIGRIKIPRWLTQYTGKKLEFIHVQGHDFPENLSEFKLIIHCGACTLNRKHVQSRINKASQSSIPITNYGILIAHLMGILKRSIRSFPEMQNLLSELE
ncbi:MAG TPA: [FeFe] hydrogenase H-cluster maturation GTPase HydF [Victivallales bacterium]|nr:[FeFe] hydrogenase H-cluster maturation GTPase HydF [Victivallales bacterium]HRU01857.1 [FeFe] hydrogenase H-cluster maturation GTPase HydF [Victivallales bacterium]